MHYSDYFTVKRRLVRGPPSCLLWWSCINAIKWCQEIFYSNPGQNSINGSKKKMRMSELLLSRCEVPRAESHQLSRSWLKGLRMHLWRDQRTDQTCSDRMTKWISEASQLVDRERECFIGVSVCADDRVMKLSMRDSTRLHIQLIECFKVTPTVWWTEGLCIECGLKQRCTIREKPPIPRSKERFETETGKTPHS